MGCSSSRSRYAVAEPEVRKPPPRSFDDLPDHVPSNQMPGSNAQVISSSQTGVAVPSKYAPSKELPTSFADADQVVNLDPEELDDEDELSDAHDRAGDRMKLAQQFWATPTADALQLRAPAPGRGKTLLSQRIVNKPSDDMAFGIQQDRLHEPQDSGAAGAATATSFLHAIPRPQQGQDELQTICEALCSDEPEITKPAKPVINAW